MRNSGILTVFGTVLLLSGCGQKPSTGAGGFPPTQVVAVPARRETVLENLSLVGNLLPDEVVDIKSEIEGVVQEINFEEGKDADKGQLLIKLDDSKLAASVAEAEANFKLSESTYERSRQLFSKTLVSQQEYDQTASVYEVNRATLELKKRLLKDTRIYAPFKGVIASRRVSPGQVITKDTTLTSLVGLDPVKVEINVPERFLGRLQIGQAIAVSVTAFPGEPFQGEVYFVTPSIDNVTRTALVKARIPNAGRKLKPGMFANLDLTLKVRENAVVVPETSVSQLIDGGGAMIYVVDKESKAELRKVQLGILMAGRVEVTSGLAPGELVIVEGLQKIGPGAPVKLAPPEAGAAYQSK